MDVSLPAFVSSVHATSSLVGALTSRVNGLAATTELVEAGAVWDELSGGSERPTAESSLKQRNWDEPICKTKFETLLEESNQVERARLLAAAESESGMWLQAIPVPSLGTQLDPDTLTVSVALRIGAPVCEPHVCRCGANVNTLGLHSLACRFSAGRLARHGELNDVVKRALQTSGVPCLLEPPGLSRDDGRRPDGITMFAYKHGKALCWDCTCVDTFASTHVNESAVRAGSAANAAETVKRAKYRSLTDRYQFEAVAIETAGTYSEGTKNIVRDIGRRLTEATGDQRETFWFMQRLSLAVQRGNAASILCGERERQRFFGS